MSRERPERNPIGKSQLYRSLGIPYAGPRTIHFAPEAISNVTGDWTGLGGGMYWPGSQFSNLSSQVQGDLDWSLPDLTAGIMPGDPPMGPGSVLNPPVSYGPMPGITQQTWSPFTMFDSSPFNPFDWQSLLGAGK